MTVNEKNPYEESSENLRKGFRAAKAGAKVLNKGKSLVSFKTKLIIYGISAFLLILSLITNTLSQSQLDNVSKFTPLNEDGEINRPKESEHEKSLWDMEFTKKSTSDLLDVIAKYKEEDYEKQKELLKNDILSHGWDLSLSMRYFEIEKEEKVTVKVGGNESEIEESISLDFLDEDERSYYPVSIKKENDALGILEKSFTSLGIYKYKTDTQDDYVVALPKVYGEVGSRFRAELKGGRVITLIKAFDTDEDLLDTSRKKLSTGGFITFIGNVPKSAAGFGEIERLYKIGSDFTAQDSSVSLEDVRILSGFSVFLENGQILKENGTYVNSKGKLIKTYWFGEKEGQINYVKTLKALIREYLDKNGHFYEIDYERKSDGSIMVYTYKETHFFVDINGIPHSYEIIKYYVHPYLIEKDIGTMEEELFGLDPDEIYVKGPTNPKNGITVSEAIDRLTQATNKLLFDFDYSSNEIILSNLDGMLEWPAPGIFNITSTYGVRYHPIFKTYKSHDGIDIGTPEGTKVVSADSGVVTLSGTYGGYGLCVKIKHDNGTETLYGHLSKVAVKVGDEVKRGQEIALSGNTGNSTGPHLHFEMRVNGKLVNPVSYIVSEKNRNKIKL